jgi:hypothetical protein
LIELPERGAQDYKYLVYRLWFIDYAMFIGSITKRYLFKLPYFGRHVKPLVPAAIAV